MSIGHKHWTIAGGWIPPPGYETVAFLNVSPQEAHVQIFVYYGDRNPVGSYHLRAGRANEAGSVQLASRSGAKLARYSLHQHNRGRRYDCGAAPRIRFRSLLQKMTKPTLPTVINSVMNK